MTLEEKYNLIYENGKRYYVLDMTKNIPVLDNAVPYYFRYKDIEIYESSWNKMTIKILNAIDENNPKSIENLLSNKYYWSKQDVFSITKKTNYTKFKGLYLNTNHTSTHAMMSIQCLLRVYDIELTECYFLVRKYHSSEPIEIKEYFKSKTINGFSIMLKIKGLATNELLLVK